MNDWTLPLHCTIVGGMSGSGKSTFTLRHMLNVEGVAARGIFDYKGEFQGRLKMRAASTANELEAALRTRWVIYNPHRMFPGETEKAFLYFCKWFFEVSKRGRGRKILYVDEAWQYCSPHKIPIELATCVQTGRGWGLETFFMAQRPHLLNGSIRGGCTEFVCLRLQEEASIETALEAGIPRGIPESLQVGEYYAVNCAKGGMLRGNLF